MGFVFLLLNLHYSLSSSISRLFWDVCWAVQRPWAFWKISDKLPPEWRMTSPFLSVNLIEDHISFNRACLVSFKVFGGDLLRRNIIPLFMSWHFIFNHFTYSHVTSLKSGTKIDTLSFSLFTWVLIKVNISQGFVEMDMTMQKHQVKYISIRSNISARAGVRTNAVNNCMLHLL